LPQSKREKLGSLLRASPTDPEISTLMLTKGTVNFDGQPL